MRLWCQSPYRFQQEHPSDGLYWFFQPTTASQENVSFTVTKTDFDPKSETRTVTKDLVNRHDFQFGTEDKPIANPDEYFMMMNSSLIVTVGEELLANDYIPSAWPVNIVIESNVDSGKLTFNQNGSFVYVPEQDFYGMDSFSYKLNYGMYDSNTVSVSLYVVQVNTPNFYIYLPLFQN